ncbi:hypothetical protein DOK78_002537 [Enterococcus sp. DIV2402]|uniref:ABC transporter domain-containing protein n=1 Tax=Candidatus Enterococcus lowellii TaxID=2230877 RepID=A0ABZ2SQ42_9ENTE|nr:dipeptide/oligopeptide/nickel ABC transporter ATP-binding protein [Enterococcus sp. DIV2402]MBO0463346.1 ABC transporter ATP-binding protein [Enterococcus sp. DIV2402]
MTINLLEVKNLEKKYGNQLVIEDCNFQLNQRQWLGIVGKNGSGKSTLVKMIVGLEKCTKGVIYLEGKKQEDVSMKKWVQTIQLVAQYTRKSLDPSKTIEQILSEPLIQFQLCQKQQIKMTIEKILLDCDLSKKTLSKRPHELSGGQYQRICLAVALLVKPRILICDEATANLDKINEKRIINLLKKQKNMAVLFISHNSSLVKKTCDDVIYMKDFHSSDKDRRLIE